MLGTDCADDDLELELVYFDIPQIGPPKQQHCGLYACSP